MSKFKFTKGKWNIKGQDIISDAMNGYICTWSGNSADAKLISYAPEMIKSLINNYITYMVLKEIFEFNRPRIWQMIKGAYLNTPEKTKHLIESATDMSIREAIKAMEGEK
jgi:hypothetical protein